MGQRIFITGIGWLTPLGSGVEPVWSSLLCGRSGITHITRFDATGLPTRIAGEVPGFDPAAWMEPREVRRLERFSQFAVCASQMAVEDAGVVFAEGDPLRQGAIVGSGAGGLGAIEDARMALLERGFARVSPLSVPRMMINAGSSQVAQRFGLRGPCFGVALACASGSAAIAQAAELLRADRVDVVLAGGAEACLTPTSLAAFSMCRSLSRHNEKPAEACRPFDLRRDGFVMSEGAGVLVLETESHALRRGARAYAELAGWAMTADAHHLTEPEPEGHSAADAMLLALRAGGESAENVRYVNAHGTGTLLNDVTESRAIRRALGPAADRVAVSSSKSMLGHMLGAAGAVEAAITALAVRDGRIPPTRNVQEQDPACDLDVVPEGSRQDPELEVAISNSFAFGGQNVVLLLRKITEAALVRVPGQS